MGEPRILKLFDSQPGKSLQDEVKDTFSEIEKEREIKNKRKTRRKPNNNSQDGSATKTPPHTTYNIHQENNNGNVIGHVEKFYSQSTKVIKTPPPDTIGADGHLTNTLKDKINELADTRAKDFVKQRKYPTYEAAIGPVYQVIYKGFRSFMGRPSWDRRQAITIIKELNVNQFDEILNYFNEKLSQTVTGKIKGAMKKSTSGTPFHMLMNRERELLAKIGFKPVSPEVYAALKRYYGVSSHKCLHTSQHKDWISHIESIVDKAEKGILDLRDIKF